MRGHGALKRQIKRRFTKELKKKPRPDEYSVGGRWLTRRIALLCGLLCLFSSLTHHHQLQHHCRGGPQNL